MCQGLFVNQTSLKVLAQQYSVTILKKMTPTDFTGQTGCGTGCWSIRLAARVTS